MNFLVIFIELQLFGLLIKATRLSPADPHSYSRPDQIKTRHIHWQFSVDFDQKVLNGHVVLTLEKVYEKGHNVTSLLLDGKSLNIEKVIDLSCDCELQYKYEFR